MRMVGSGFLGLLLGGVAGFWLGLMVGLIYTELAQVSCFEGLCGYVAAGVGAACAALGGLAGAVYAVRRSLQRRASEAVY